ncbi:MAG: hypothetical protein ACOXZZ_00045 [Sphaerochaetaceae bacterium]|jgi:hypothetical protein
MKKVLVLLIAFAIVGGAFLFANDGIVENSNTLNVTGYILSPEKLAELDVNQTLTEPIDIVGNSDFQEDGNGVLIGNWVVSTYAHVGDEGYKVTYTYGDLESASTTQSLEYKIVVHTDATGSGGVDKGTGESTEFVAGEGETTAKRYVRVKLVEDEDPTLLDPATDFTSTITLNLTTNL